MLKVTEQKGVTIAELTPGRRNVFVYLVDGILIDTGPASAQNELIPFYKESNIDFVCLTHSHEDHSGTGSWIEKNLGIPIYAHEKAIAICRQPGDYPLYRQELWGKREGFHTEPLKDAIQSKHYTWQIIDTPGHSQDHVALFNKETGVLFTGDLYVSPKTKIIMDTESIPETMESIRRVLTYDFDDLFCGHAGYVKEGKSLLQMKLDHLENVSGEIIHRYKLGQTMQEITDGLFPKKYPLIAQSDHEWDSLHIVRSVIGGYQKGDKGEHV